MEVFPVILFFPLLLNSVPSAKSWVANNFPFTSKTFPDSIAFVFTPTLPRVMRETSALVN